MRIGYARVSIQDQDNAAQIVALNVWRTCSRGGPTLLTLNLKRLRR